LLLKHWGKHEKEEGFPKERVKKTGENFKRRELKGVRKKNKREVANNCWGKKRKALKRGKRQTRERGEKRDCDGSKKNQ